MQYKVLTFDGGGMRGLIEARLIQRLSEAIGREFWKEADLFAGTSTGAIMACALAAGKSPSEIIDLYRNDGPSIFHDALIDEIVHVGILLGARYGTEGRHSAFTKVFGEKTTLGDLPKHVIVCTFDLNSADGIGNAPSRPAQWRPKFFHNFPVEDKSDDDRPQLVVDVLCRTSAAPTFFPIYQGYIDGGVVANNPSMCAVAEALNPKTGKQSPQDIRLLSMGTGNQFRAVDSQDGNYGLIAWAQHGLIDIILGGMEGLADYQCSQLLGDCYQRLNPVLDPPLGLDAAKPEDIRKLLDAADQADLSRAIAWIERQWPAPAPVPKKGSAGLA